MGICRIGVLFLVLKLAYCSGTNNYKSSIRVPMFIPCRHDDIGCIEKSLNLFGERTGYGIPEYGIIPVDPGYIPKLCIHKKGLKICFSNISVYGLRYRELIKLKITRSTFSVVTREQNDVSGDVSIELTDVRKFFTGKCDGSAKTISSVDFDYDIISGDCDGQQHMDIGTPNIRSKTIKVTNYSLSPKLYNQMMNDPDGARIYKKYAKEVIRELPAKIVSFIYRQFVHNAGVVLRILDIDGEVFLDLNEIPEY